MISFKYRYIFYFSGVIIASLIEGFALSKNGPFFDSAIYLDLYNFLYDNDLIQTVNYTLSHGKFEPVILILFLLEKYLFFKRLSESAFLFINILILNILLNLSIVRFMNIPKNKLKSLIIGILVVTSYLYFAKVLWFWRSILGLSFFFLSIRYKRNNIYFYIFALLCIFSHYSYILFYFLYYILKIGENNKNINYYFSISTLIIISSIFLTKSAFFNYIVSNGNSATYFESYGFINNFKNWFFVLYSFFILCLLYTYYRASSYKTIYFFTLLLTTLSLINFNNFQLMNRIFLPASFAIIFLTINAKNNSIYISLSKILLLITCIPGFRLIINLFLRKFNF